MEKNTNIHVSIILNYEYVELMKCFNWRMLHCLTCRIYVFLSDAPRRFEERGAGDVDKELQVYGWSGLGCCPAARGSHCQAWCELQLT